MKNKRYFVLIIFGLFLIFLPSFINMKYSYDADVPCRDAQLRPIANSKCQGTRNNIMEHFAVPIYILAIIGVMILIYGVLYLIPQGEEK